YHIFFFFHVSPTTEIYTLSLHDALPISWAEAASSTVRMRSIFSIRSARRPLRSFCSNSRIRPLCLKLTITGSVYSDNCHLSMNRSEEHTSELQSRGHLVCRLLLEKKKNK